MTSRPGALSAHIGYLFTELPLARRPAAARAAGFTAVEHPVPFALPARDLRAILDDNGLGLAQISSGMGGKGEKGIAALPGREAEFRDSYAHALDYAEEVGARYVHAMSGIGGSAATYHANIEHALRLAKGRAVQVLVEAISDATVPGYHMSSITALLALAGDFPDLRILIDTFHACACGISPQCAIRAAGKSLGHVHLADHPGRAEPGTGEIDFRAVTSALDSIGYSGAIGFEYIPSGQSHLDWRAEFAADPALRSMQGKGDMN